MASPGKPRSFCKLCHHPTCVDLACIRGAAAGTALDDTSANLACLAKARTRLALKDAAADAAADASQVAPYLCGFFSGVALGALICKCTR